MPPPEFENCRSQVTVYFFADAPLAFLSAFGFFFSFFLGLLSPIAHASVRLTSLMRAHYERTGVFLSMLVDVASLREDDSNARRPRSGAAALFFADVRSTNAEVGVPRTG